LGAELFLEFGVGGFDGFEEEGILGPVVESGAVDFEFRGDGGIWSPKPRAMAAAAWMGVKLVSKCVEFEEGEEWVEVFHNEPRMEGGAKKSAGWVSVNR
jgi:hypothetical protein